MCCARSSEGERGHNTGFFSAEKAEGMADISHRRQHATEFHSGTLNTLKPIQAMKPKHFQVVFTLRIIQLLMQQILQPVRKISQLETVGIMCQERRIPTHGFVVKRTIASIKGSEISSYIASVDKCISLRHFHSVSLAAAPGSTATLSMLQ